MNKWNTLFFFASISYSGILLAKPDTFVDVDSGESRKLFVLLRENNIEKSKTIIGHRYKILRRAFAPYIENDTEPAYINGVSASLGKLDAEQVNASSVYNLFLKPHKSSAIKIARDPVISFSHTAQENRNDRPGFYRDQWFRNDQSPTVIDSRHLITPPCFRVRQRGRPFLGPPCF